MDKLFVSFGLEILKKVPGRVSTEVDARYMQTYNKVLLMTQDMKWLLAWAFQIYTVDKETLSNEANFRGVSDKMPFLHKKPFIRGQHISVS